MKEKIFFDFSICISKDAEWSKMYIFHQRKKNGSKGKFQHFMKISGKKRFLMDTLTKMSQNIFAYFSASQHSAYFSPSRRNKKN